MSTSTTLDWWVEPPPVDLAEIMDELEPGWAAWRAEPPPVE
jgi:hypothetical protein